MNKLENRPDAKRPTTFANKRLPPSLVIKFPPVRPSHVVSDSDTLYRVGQRYAGRVAVYRVGQRYAGRVLLCLFFPFPLWIHLCSTSTKN